MSKEGARTMKCPKHPEVWLYENMFETHGFCPKCQKWYKGERGMSKWKPSDCGITRKRRIKRWFSKRLKKEREQ